MVWDGIVVYYYYMMFDVFDLYKALSYILSLKDVRGDEMGNDGHVYLALGHDVLCNTDECLESGDVPYVNLKDAIAKFNRIHLCSSLLRTVLCCRA